jgi:hypothetical protein
MAAIRARVRLATRWLARWAGWVVLVVGAVVVGGWALLRALDTAAEQDEAARAVAAARTLGYKPDGPWPMVVLMPAHGRPAYLERVLHALAAAEHANRTLVVVSQDGNDPAVSALLEAAALGGAGAPLKLLRLRHRPPYWSLPSLVVRAEYATSANVRFLLSVAFDALQAPWAVVLESDLVPAPDALAYFAWAAGHFLLPDAGPWADRVLCVNGFSDASRPGADPYAVHPAPFVVWGWATARRLWPLFVAGWTRFDGWDYAVQRLRVADHRFCVSPALSRIRNIGMQGINFNVPPAEAARWDTYLSPGPVPYSVATPPQLINFNEEVVCPLVSGSPLTGTC